MWLDLPWLKCCQSNIDDIEKSDVLEQLGLEPGKYILLSAHREENIDIEKEFLLIDVCG